MFDRNFSIEEQISFAYIDGDHSYESVRNDFLKALPLLSDGAVVVFDDYSDQFPGVIKFVDELTQVEAVEIIDKEHPDVAVRVNNPEQVKLFDAGGYHYDDNLSSENEWVFTR